MKDKVYHYMDLSSNLKSVLPIVRFLQKNDEDYHPGAWFAVSDYFTVRNQSTFKKLLVLVQTQVLF